MSHSEVKGMNGVTMRDEFEPEPNVYLAVTVPKFPNYFTINGVRGKVYLVRLHGSPLTCASGSALPAVSEILT